jgi:shikimate dehydrogenase
MNAGEITGRTRLFGVIADPIGHVRACEAFNPRFAERGIDAVLVPLHVRANDLRAALDGFRALANLGGVLVTIPHKEAILELVDAVGPQAARVGAGNVIRRLRDGRLEAENFDGLGFVAGLAAAGHAPAGRDVLLVGAGGAGKAIAFALAEAGVRRLVVANRNAARAEALAADLRAVFPAVDATAGPAEVAGFDLIVNATSLGLAADDPLPVNLAAAAPGTVVCEIIMKPERTPLVETATARGLAVHLGRHMLDRQVPLLARFIGAFDDADRAGR